MPMPKTTPDMSVIQSTTPAPAKPSSSYVSKYQATTRAAGAKATTARPQTIRAAVRIAAPVLCRHQATSGAMTAPETTVPTAM